MKHTRIDKMTVHHIARLSRLSLTEEQVKTFSEELSVILEYISKLNQLDTTNVPPTSHAVSDVKNVFRQDKVKQSLALNEVLKNAPRRIKDFFGVPKVI